MPLYTNNLFGDIDAELDVKSLKEDFISTYAFYNSMNEHCYLLRGFKGCGKTAFRIRLQMCNDTFCCDINEKKCNLSLKFCDEGPFEIIFIKSDDLKLDNLFELSIEAQSKRHFGIQNEMLRLWEILCKIEVFKRLPELQSNEAYKRFVSRTKLDTSNPSKIVSALLDAMARLVTRDPKMMDYTEEFFDSALDLKNDFDEAERAARNILMTSNKKYYIFFDGFDRYLDGILHTYSKNAKQNFTLDLTNSLIILGYDFLKGSVSSNEDTVTLPNVYCKVLLPEDFIIRTEMRDAIKYLDKSILLNWDRNDLKEFICTRIHSIIEKKHENLTDSKMEQIWKRMFGDELTNRYHSNSIEDSFEYFLRHTLFRPRDFQILCSRVVEEMNVDRKFKNSAEFVDAISEDPIPQDYIRDGINSGCRHLVGRLYEEFQIINFQMLLEGFSKKKSIMSYAKVYEVLEDYCNTNKLNVDETIRTLFNIGFLGKFIHGDEKIAEMYRKYRNLKNVNNSGKYYIALFSFAGHYNEYPLSNWDVAISPVFYDTLEIRADRRIIYP